MKVLGCELIYVACFYLEAAIIGMLGGIWVSDLVMAFVYIESFVGRAKRLSSFGEDIGIPPWLAIASIIFATIIGLMSGLYPARRAMKLSALDAIRTE